MLFLAENNACCQRVCRVVHRHAGKVCQNLSRHKVCLALFRVEQGLGRDHIVVTILCHLVPQALRHRLIPRKPQLLMVDAQLDFKLLKALFFRREVVNISVGQVVRLTKEARVFVDDPVGQRIDLLHRHPDHAGPEDMVVVLAVVEADQPILCQGLDLVRRRIHHAVHRLLLGKLPVHEQQVREHLHVEKYQWRFHPHRGLPLNFILRFEVHLRHDLQAGVRLVRAAGGKAQDRIPHVVYVVNDIALIGFVHDVGNKVNAGLRIGADLFGKGFLDEDTQVPLILDLLCINHFRFSLQWQAAADGRNRNIIAFRQFSPQRGLPREHLDLDVLVVDPAQLRCIAGVNIMQVDARTRFAQLRIGLGPFGGSFQVALEALFSIRPGNIKVDDNVILRNFHVVQSRSIQFGQF